jgi:hypothetical protein
MLLTGARRTVVRWDTILQALRSQVRVLLSWIIFLIYLIQLILHLLLIIRYAYVMFWHPAKLPHLPKYEMTLLLNL